MLSLIQGHNPLYKGATSTFMNITYRGKEWSLLELLEIVLFLFPLCYFLPVVALLLSFLMCRMYIFLCVNITVVCRDSESSWPTSSLFLISLPEQNDDEILCCALKPFLSDDVVTFPVEYFLCVICFRLVCRNPLLKMWCHTRRKIFICLLNVL